MTKERFTTPVGRFVQGDLFVPSMTDQQGNPRLIRSGPNAGQPSPQFFVALAIAKNDPGLPAFDAILDRVARASWPTLFPAPGGPCTVPTFAWKKVDGDGYDTMGKPNAGKEGFAGHWIYRFTSGFAARVFHAGHYAAHEVVTTPQGHVKRGDFLRISGDISGNDQPTKPGIYLNFDLVEIAGHGQEIVTGPDATAAFSAPAALPPGASLTPVAPPVGAPIMPPGAPPPPPGAPAPYAPPAAPPAPYAPPAAPPPPYQAYMAPPAAPPAPPAPPPPPPAPPPPPMGPTMLPAAQGATYESLLLAGWTDETLRQYGMMA